MTASEYKYDVSLENVDSVMNIQPYHVETPVPVQSLVSNKTGDRLRMIRWGEIVYAYGEMVLQLFHFDNIDSCTIIGQYPDG